MSMLLIKLAFVIAGTSALYSCKGGHIRIRVAPDETYNGAGICFISMIKVCKPIMSFKAFFNHPPDLIITKDFL